MTAKIKPLHFPPLLPATGKFEQHLRQALPAPCFPEFTPHYRQEPRGRWQTREGVLVAPKTTAQVAQVLTMANKARVGIVPFGGGTGLVGGQIMQDGPPPIILSLHRMNKIHPLDPHDDILNVEAGAVLENVHKAAQEAGRLFPLSLASKGSAQIGGLLSTNAGGINVLRYGSMRHLCMGLTVVLPDGKIWNGLSRLHKDNTGYDLKHLMIGSEGTLGVITAASLRLFFPPAMQGTAVMVVPNPQAALALLALAQGHVADAITSFELIQKQGLDFICETLPQVSLPFEKNPDWCILIELGMAQNSDPLGALETLFELAYKAKIATDGVIAQSQRQAAALWHMREAIPTANRHIGSVKSHDISVPVASVPEFITRADALIAKIDNSLRVNCFGHLGDGNMHYNVFPAANKTADDYAPLAMNVQNSIHDLVHEMGGSIAAEHGVGRLKVRDLQKYGEPVKHALMSDIKRAIDPKGIMNPRVLFRA